MSDATKWDHKGVEITLTRGGQFEAYIGEKRIVKPSLSALKTAIDEAGKFAFVPFDALMESGWETEMLPKVKGTDLIRVRVTGLEKIARGRGHRAGIECEFVARVGSRDSSPITRELYAESDAAVAAYKAVQEHRREVDRIKDELDDKMDKLKAVLKKYVLAPGDYAKPKPSKSP